MDERMHKLHEMVNKGIDEITAKNSLDKDTICLAGQLVDIRKDLSTIEAMEDYGYSEGYYGDRRHGRDGDGRYYERYANRRYYDDGYSRNSMIDHLEKAMQNASTEQERQAIQRMIMQSR